MSTDTTDDMVQAMDWLDGLASHPGRTLDLSNAVYYATSHDTFSVLCRESGLMVARGELPAAGWHWVHGITDAMIARYAEPTPVPRRRRGLPTFGEMRQNALRLLGDAQAELRSDWRDGTGPTRQQAAALRVAQTAIARAKTALDRAAQR